MIKKVKKTLVKEPVRNNRNFVPTKLELDEIRAWCKSLKDRAFEIGERLNTWKKKMGHGEWLPFFKKYLEGSISLRAANDYMTLAANKSKLASVQHMSITEMLTECRVKKGIGERRGSTKTPKAKTPKASKESSNGKSKREALDEQLDAMRGKGVPTNVTQFPERKLDATTFREDLNDLIKRYLGRITRNNMSAIMRTIVKTLEEGKKVA